MPRMTSAELAAYEARHRLPSPRVLEGVEREAQLHEQIFTECRRRGWQVLHGSMSERTHRTLGEPDFTILADEGRVIFVEAKSRTGKLSPAQRDFKHHAEGNKHTIHVVRSLLEFLDTIRKEPNGPQTYQTS